MDVETEIIPLLRQSEVFQVLDRASAERLARRVSERRFPAGERIVERGAPGEQMFVIVDGEVEVPIADPAGAVRFVARLGRGEIFGEIALLTGEARSADVVAATDCRCLVLARADVEQLIREHVEVARLLTAILGERLLRSGALRQVGKYRLLGEIARGSMSIVYEAVHPELERVVAVKMLSHEKVYKPRFLDHFRNEARIIGRLRHPNIVEVYDTEEAYATFFIVMERLPGTSLDRVLAERGKLPADEARSILRQVAAALHFAHQEGIVHRDVKPSNIALGGDGRAKLMDFGLAFESRQASSDRALGAGTPLYMAPEQVDGEAVDARSDVYSLGMVAYEILTGRPAFSGTVLEVMNRQRDTPVPSPRAADPAVPADLEELVARATAKDPARRFQSCREVVRFLGPVSPVTLDGVGIRTLTFLCEPGREQALDDLLEETRRRAAAAGVVVR